MANPLSFRLKKQFDRYIHDPIAAALSIPLFLILKILPYKISSYLCGTLMYLIAPLTSYNSRVKKHMHIAFPKKTKKEINKLASQHWFMLGQTIGEMPHINKLIRSGNLETEGLDKIKNEKLLAFCGLANSNKFYKTLKENGFNVTSTKSFPDHYEYKNEDIDKLILEANIQNLKLITTEKDYVKINDNKNIINFLPIEMELDMKDKAVFKPFLQEKLNG